VKLDFDSMRDKEIELFLIRTETEGIIALANGILKLARVYNVNRENFQELGINIFDENVYPTEFVNLLRIFNPGAYRTPIDLETAIEIIDDFFTGIRRPAIREDQAEWLRKNLP